MSLTRSYHICMKYFLSVIFIVCGFALPTFKSCKQNPPSNDSITTVEITTDTVKLLFVGDVMGHSTQIAGAWRDGGDSCHNYIPTFQWIKDYISSADIAIANLEVTLAGVPYTGYPHFSSPNSLAAALKDAGFNTLAIANNHTLDRGKTGLERTINTLDSIGISHTGAFKNQTARDTLYPLIIEKNNFKIALLNYTYGTNGIAVEQPNIVNYIDTVQILTDITKARNLQADYIITYLHWGDEYSIKENARQRQIATFLAKNGCNLIVEAHPHVIQPIVKNAVESNDSVPVAYSLGNFVSNQRDRYRDGGIALEITLTKTNGEIKVESLKYEPIWVLRYQTGKGYIFRLIQVNDFIANPEKYPLVNNQHKNSMMLFYNDTKDIIGM